MKKILFLILLFVSIGAFGQKIDLIIKTKILISYFSNYTNTPLFVKYNLYHGGGNCSREGMTFHNYMTPNVSISDYSYTGFDIGHMANAEDFANNSVSELSTFQLYNALPQTAKLNRGVWKEFEGKIRKLSQTDSLLIICGGFKFDSIVNRIRIPRYCYKIVKDKKTLKITCLLFPNDKSNTVKQIQLSDLLRLITYDTTEITKGLN